MPAYSMHDVVLVRYPFSDVSTAKVRPAVVVSAPHASRDLFVVPLTYNALVLGCPNSRGLHRRQERPGAEQTELFT